MLQKKLFIFILLVLVFSSIANGKANDKRKDVTSDIKMINAEVDALEKRSSKGEKGLPVLKVEYDFHDATEGVPPNFDFYYETKETGANEKQVLRVCKTHVGLETFAKDYFYYFDSEGRPMKYLSTHSGTSGDGGFPASRHGIIYDKSGKIIWTSGNVTPPISFKEVKELFNSIDTKLKKFQ
jgi:hypothetical protein